VIRSAAYDPKDTPNQARRANRCDFDTQPMFSHPSECVADTADKACAETIVGFAQTIPASAPMANPERGQPSWGCGRGRTDNDRLPVTMCAQLAPRRIRAAPPVT
jgi:hypothetical protein